MGKVVTVMKIFPQENFDLEVLLANVKKVQGCIKAVFFGFMVALIGCYQGYNAQGGGRGVGIGTTRAVVIASVSTLVLDYFLTDILLHVMPSSRGQW